MRDLRLRHGWAIEFVGSPLDNYRTHLGGERTVIGARLYHTREEARKVLREYRTQNAWWFKRPYACHGGNAIYRSARVVSVSINLWIDE